MLSRISRNKRQRAQFDLHYAPPLIERKRVQMDTNGLNVAAWLGRESMTPAGGHGQNVLMTTTARRAHGWAAKRERFAGP